MYLNPLASLNNIIITLNFIEKLTNALAYLKFRFL